MALIIDFMTSFSAILSFVENNNINYCFSAFNTNTQVLPIFSPSKNTQKCYNKE